MTPEQLAAYLAQHPQSDPKQNQQLNAAVNAPDYEDRGMWGPLGGKGGTMSQLWLDEMESIGQGATSEFGLMTIVPAPSGAQEDVQNH